MDMLFDSLTGFGLRNESVSNSSSGGNMRDTRTPDKKGAETALRNLVGKGLFGF